MARQLLTAISPIGSYPVTPLTANSADLTFTAANPTDKEQVAASGKDLILVWNTHAANPYTVSFDSVKDEKNRVGDIDAYSIGAGEIACFGPFKQAGWMQSDGNIYFEAENAAIKYAVIRVP